MADRKKTGPLQRVARNFIRPDMGSMMLQKATARSLRRRTPGSKPEKGETRAHEAAETPSYERMEKD